MIKVFASKVFSLNAAEALNGPSILQEIGQISTEGTYDMVDDNQENNSQNSISALNLSKLCFMVGHVAVKEIVHLEAIEAEWKRRKYLGTLELSDIIIEKKEITKSSDDLEQVNGTAEDEFSERIIHVRERELLYGEKALLAIFGPMISFICLHNRSFNVFVFKIIL